MKYRSLSLTGFEAVQVDLDSLDPIKSHRWRREKLDWFQAMMDTGDIAPVITKDEQYIMLNNKNSTFRCYNGEYIVRNRAGLVFWMPKELFEESFRPDTGWAITRKQQEVLDYIATCEKAPSVREIAAAIGAKSPGSVHKHLKALRDGGFITWTVGKKRSLAAV